MNRTRSGKTLLEVLVMVVVLLGLGGMLAHAVSKVRAGFASPDGTGRHSARFGSLIAALASLFGRSRPGAHRFEPLPSCAVEGLSVLSIHLTEVRDSWPLMK